MRIHRLTTSWWRDAAIAGTAGGALMLLYGLLATGTITDWFWLPLTTLATGIPYLPMPSAGWVPVLMGLAIHLMIAAAWGLVYASFMSVFTRASDERLHRSWLVGGLVGVAFGVVVYLVMGAWAGRYVATGVRILNQNHFFLSHLVYGATTGLLMTALTRRAPSRYGITMAPGVRERVSK